MQWITCSIASWFRSGRNIKLTIYSMLKNLPAQLENQADNYMSPNMEELRSIQCTNPKGRHKKGVPIIQDNSIIYASAINKHDFLICFLFYFFFIIIIFVVETCWKLFFLRDFISQNWFAVMNLMIFVCKIFNGDWCVLFYWIVLKPGGVFFRV